jgi:hypothetical protein
VFRQERIKHQKNDGPQARDTTGNRRTRHGEGKVRSCVCASSSRDSFGRGVVRPSPVSCRPSLRGQLGNRFGPRGLRTCLSHAEDDDPKPETLPATPRQLGFLGWSLVSCCVIIGLGFNWACAFLWFSRRYAFFSIPVIAVAGLIMAFCAAIALLVARLTGGNWRRALAVFVFAEVVPAAVVLRFGLLR